MWYVVGAVFVIAWVVVFAAIVLSGRISEQERKAGIERAWKESADAKRRHW